MLNINKKATMKLPFHSDLKPNHLHRPRLNKAYDKDFILSSKTNLSPS